MSDETTTTERAAAEADPVESLLAEYEQAKAPQPAKPAPAAQPAVDPAADLRARLDALEADHVGNKVETQLAKAVRLIKDEYPDLKKLSDKAIRGAIREAAENDSRFRTAFFTAPEKQWAKIVASVGKDLLPEPEDAPDPKTTADRAAMRESLKSVGTKTPEPERDEDKIWKMSPAEFRKYRASLGG